MDAEASRSAEWFDVVVVGAGVSGIGAAWHLRTELPDLTFTMLEARDAIGGTWDLFRYPGVRSDSDVQTYAYAWKPWADDDTVAAGDAILHYLDDAVDEHDLRRHVQFGRRVRQIDWSSSESAWTVDVEDTATGERTELRCWWIVAATGYFRYDRGHLPEFAGVDGFRGAYFHAQEWPEGLTVDGARVVVIGSGATAATLVPALADLGAQVTMLQRSPSYYLSLPAQDPIADAMRRHLSTGRAETWIRGKNQATQALFYRLCRWFPAGMRRVLVADASRRLPEGYDVATHFTPAYAPWDQRMCIVPDGDLFAAISSGRAEVVTGVIDTFTEDGVRLASGAELPADIVVAATGLEVLALGDMRVAVDDEQMIAGERVVYKSVMLSDLPNFAYVFGYTNATWTLKVDLACSWICRVISHMRRTGATKAVVAPDDPAMPTRSMLDLAAGYLTRAVERIPRQGTGVWSVPKGFRTDARRLLRDPVDDGVLRFSRAESVASPVGSSPTS